MSSRTLAVCIATLGLCLLGACSENTPSPAAPDGPLDGEFGLGIDGQAGTVAQKLPNDLLLVVRRLDGSPVANADVRWETIGGAGTIAPALSRTDGQGRTIVSWTLGDTVGRQLARAILPGNDTVRVSAWARADTNAHVVTLRADTADLPLGIGRTAALAVDVRDRYGNALGAKAPTLRSLDPSIATVTSRGIVLALSAGTARIVGAIDRVADTLSIAIVAVQPRGWRDVAGGLNYGCAIAHTGDGHCWGLNRSNQLGDGTILNRPLPVRVIAPAGVRFRQLAAANATTCGVDDAGAIWCWGAQRDGTTSGTPVRLEVPSGSNAQRYVALSLAGGIGSGEGAGVSACALTDSGHIHCWGANGVGQLGNGTTVASPAPTPIDVPEGIRFSGLALGGTGSCATDTDGGVWCWGSNVTSPVAASATLRPVRIALPGGVGARSVTAGEYHACAATTDARVFCWGRNNRRQTGSLTGATLRAPVEVSLPAGTTPTAVHAGGLTTCASTTSDELFCWGAGTVGELGDGTYEDSATPHRVALPTGVRVARMAGNGQLCAVTAAGDLYCWGSNVSGGLGAGDYTDSPWPRKIRNPAP